MESADQGRREKALFEQALDLASAAERLAFLKGACGEDSALLARVQALLQAHDTAEGFLPDEPTGPTPFVSVSEKPGDRIGRYKLREKIGEGGCGVVYVAEQEEPVRRKVALKVIKLGMDTQSVIARFEAERQALALMDHPHIAKVLDAGATETGRPYFVMELVRGVKLTEYCDEQQLPMRERLELFIKVCQAVQHAHQKGIIHRDLKPSNILVTVNDGVPVPKVIDFGIAKATGGKLTDLTIYTDFHQFIGTPAYMSPEQATMTSLDIDTRSDIYTLGVLLYELLTGHTPFETKELMAQGVDAMRKTIRETEPVRPSTKLSQGLVAASRQSAADSKKDNHGPLRSHRQSNVEELIRLLRGDLDWIVMKCLEKDRARRYETANGLAFDLKRHLGNEPVLARPPNVAYQFQKAFRRHKLVYSAATAILVTLVIGLGSATVMFLRERAALSGEQQQRMQAQTAQKTAESERQYSRQLLYAADMNLAQQALNQNNLGEARRLLDRHRPQPGEEDLRGWEWRYLWQLTRSSALVTLTNRPVPGYSVSFSPDGTRLAVAWYDARVDLWDVPGRRWLRTLAGSRKEQYLAHVAFSPAQNLLAAASAPRMVALYDLDSGTESVLWRAPDEGWWDVRDLSFSPDGSRVVIYAGSLTPGLGDAVWVVNVTSRKIESRHPTDASRWNNQSARLSPDNQRLYLEDSDWANNRSRIQCLDLTTGRELWQTEPQRVIGPNALALSPDGRVLASASGFDDATIHLWDAATGKPLVPPLAGHTGWVSKLIFTQDGHRLISGASDQTIRFWDTGTWAETAVLRGHTDQVLGLAVSEPAQLIASAGKDGNLTFWNTQRPEVQDGYVRLPGTLDQILPLDNSRALLLGKPTELFDLRRGGSLGLVNGLGPFTNILSFSSNWLCRWDGTNKIVVAEWNGLAFIQRGAVAIGLRQRPSLVQFNPARQLVAWTEPAASNSICLAALVANGSRIELPGEISKPAALVFSEDGKYLTVVPPRLNFSQDWDRPALRVWNVDTGRSVLALNESVTDAAFANGGRILVTFVYVSGEDNEIRFYDLDHPDRAPRVISGRLGPRSLTISPDGRLVAATTDAGVVRLCNAVTGEWIEDLPGLKDDGVGFAAFSKDGQRLIFAGDGRETIRLWDVGTRQNLLNLAGTGSVISKAYWSTDGDTLLAGAPWQAWHAPSWAEIAAAEAKEK